MIISKKNQTPTWRQFPGRRFTN